MEKKVQQLRSVSNEILSFKKQSGKLQRISTLCRVNGGFSKTMK
jgi:hypothetical protein